jgi:hypothetical protein
LTDRVDDPAQQVLQALDIGDWAKVRLLLHPYLRWRWTDGSETRGRNRVMEALRSAGEPLSAPDSVELRDGQVYRWLS